MEDPHITLHLTEAEAEWLTAVMGLVMEISRKWDDRNDLAGAVSVKLSVARLKLDVDRDDERRTAST